MTNRSERIEKAWNDAWGNGEVEAFRGLLADGYVRHSKSGTEDAESVIATIQAQHQAFPGLSTRIIHLVEQDDEMALHWESSGTHEGEFFDVAGTSRVVTVTGASFLRFEGDRIAEEWAVWDPREFLSAIGIWHLGNGAD